MIKTLIPEDKPREKAMSSQDGVRRLTDTELLAVMIETGTAGKSCIEIAQELLYSYGNSLPELSRASIKELSSRVNGIGKAKAIKILSAIELGSRVCEKRISDTNSTYDNSEDLYLLLRYKLEPLTHEEFWVVPMDKKKKLLRQPYRIATGTERNIQIDHKQIFRYLLSIESIACVAFAHNHPGGTVFPSKEDDTLTSKLVFISDILGIKVIDHLIISPTGEYYSYQDAKKMPEQH